MVNHTQDFVAVKKYEILQYSLIPTSRGFIDSSTTGTVMTDICTELGRAPGVPAILGEMVMVSGVRTVVSVQPAPASGSTGTMVAGTLLTSPSSAVSTPSDHQD